MEPGRKLDALIAEKVMGEDNELIKCLEIPNYSTDISAAWQVVEKLNNFHEYDVDVVSAWTDKSELCYTCRVWEGVEMICGISKTSISHAICLAALKAVGYEE